MDSDYLFFTCLFLVYAVLSVIYGGRLFLFWRLSTSVELSIAVMLLSGAAHFGWVLMTQEMEKIPTDRHYAISSVLYGLRSAILYFVVVCMAHGWGDLIRPTPEMGAIFLSILLATFYVAILTDVYLCPFDRTKFYYAQRRLWITYAYDGIVAVWLMVAWLVTRCKIHYSGFAHPFQAKHCLLGLLWGIALVLSVVAVVAYMVAVNASNYFAKEYAWDYSRKYLIYQFSQVLELWFCAGVAFIGRPPLFVKQSYQATNDDEATTTVELSVTEAYEENVSTLGSTVTSTIRGDDDPTERDIV